MAATLRDYYNTGNDDWLTIVDSTYKLGQSFTTTSAYNITSIKILMFRGGSPGTLTWEIYATSSGLPTGSALCSGTTNGNTLTTSSSGEWREITFGTPATLSDATKYAIVYSCAGLDGSNYISWNMDASTPSYSGGARLYYPGSAPWLENTGNDCMFETWGEPAAVDYTLEVSAGTFTLTGIANTLLKALKMAVTVGEFTLTGIANTLLKALKMATTVGEFVLTGFNITFLKTLKIVADVGTFVLTGIDNVLLKALKMATSVGTFALTGIDNILKVGHTIIASVGTFTLTGIDIAFKKTLNMVANVGTFTLTGFDMLLGLAYKIATTVGEFILTGFDALFSGFWTYKTKNTSTYNNKTKNTSSYTNKTKNASSWSYKTKK